MVQTRDPTTGQLFDDGAARVIPGFADESGGFSPEGHLNQRHNRYMTVDIDATHPGNDTTSITFTQDENVRRYRVLPISGTAGDRVKVTEDAMNGLQADTWLTETNSLTGDCMFWMCEPIKEIVSGGAVAGEWSEWKELSKDQSDLSLSRLDFELFTGGTAVTEILIEAE